MEKRTIEVRQTKFNNRRTIVIQISITATTAILVMIFFTSAPMLTAVTATGQTMTSTGKTLNNNT